MSQIVLEVPDISCAHCEHTIVQALQDQPGVSQVRVSIPTHTVDLTFDESRLTRQQVAAILDEEGYPVAAVREAGASPSPKGPVIPLRARLTITYPIWSTIHV